MLTGALRSQAMLIFISTTVLLAALIAVALVVVPIATAPISWLPNASKVGPLLGTLLTAQAAIAALTLAVSLFVMQGVGTRRDADDRTYREYIRLSSVRQVFWGSLIAVGVTGIVFLIQSFIGTRGEDSTAIPDLRNLTLVATFAFLANLALAVVLFERAIHIGHPESWRILRRHVNERDVRKAIQVFLHPHSAAASPKVGEGSADEAIRALLDEGRRAMTERIQLESLQSIRKLVEHAMNEIEGASLSWGAPGSQPAWPPLRELGSNLYAFREEVILQGDRDHVNELLIFDYWAMTTGVGRDCGELFTVGLAGYRSNYEIANRVGNREFRETFRDRLWKVGHEVFSSSRPERAYSYIAQMMRHQERLLNDGMQADRPSDYEQLHQGFERFLQTIGMYWKLDRLREPGAGELYDQLRKDYRIVLMGLGGRALDLAASGRIADSEPYFNVVRGQYSQPEQLANDISQAITPDYLWGIRLWSEWDFEGSLPREVRQEHPEQYPLKSFAVRLIELSKEPIQTLGLRGNAQQVLDWFQTNSDGLTAHVRHVPDSTFEERRKLATDALRAAVRMDEAAHDYQIIGYKLSEGKVSAFQSKVHSVVSATNAIEPLLEWAGAVLDLPDDSSGGPYEQHLHDLLPKEIFADVPEDATIPYVGLDADALGRRLSNLLIKLLCEALNEAPNQTTPLHTPEALFRAIDEATTVLNPSGQLVAVLAGDWLEVELGLGAKEREGYEPGWLMPETDLVGNLGRYRGHHILQAPFQDERALYVVDPPVWGSLVRGHIAGAGRLLIEVSPISEERAQKLLSNNPDHFASEPDQESKLRKLQTYVEIDVRIRTGFSVTDPSRARRITSAQ